MNNNSIKLKILMLGESGVGKSSILVRYTDNKFSNSHVTTLGVEFKQKKIVLDNKNVLVQVWDTAGQERFRTITPVYYRSVQGVALVFSITDRDSYDNIQYWMQNLKDNAKIEDIKIILVGNKSDLENERQVQKAEAEKMAAEYDIPYYEASAKNSTNVSEIFEKITLQIIEQKKLSQEDTNANNNADNSSNNNNKNENEKSQENQQKNNNNIKKLESGKVEKKKSSGCCG